MDLDILRGLLRGDGPPPSVAEALNVCGRLEAPLARVCRVAGVSRSAACEQRRRRSTSEPTAPRVRRRPGPVGAMPDAELLPAIRREIAESPFVGEGHKKICARLRLRGICTAASACCGSCARPGCSPRRRRSASAPGGCTTADHHRRPRHAVGDRRRPRPRPATTVAARSSRSSTTAPAKRGSTPPRRMDRWAAADLLREVDQRALRLGRAGASPPAWRCATTAAPASARPLPGRDRPPRHRPRSPAYHYEPETNGCRREIHPDPQGTGPVDRALRHARAAPRPRPPVRRATSTSTGCSNATATAPHAKPATRSVRPPWHDRRVHQPSVRLPGISSQLERFALRTENRGVPGSSPGLAIFRARIPLGCWIF